MSTAAAPIGLTYRATDIQVLNGIFLQIVRGLFEPPEVRGVDLIVPSAEGQIVRNRVASRRLLELRGWIRGVNSSESTDRTAFVTARGAFETLFDPTLDPGNLVATLEGGSTRTIAARTLNVVSEIVVPTFWRVSVELESVAPDWS